ncbi:MAG: tyrosine-type recombinase/integrase [Candidatus Nanopelagicales bacterium]
MTSPGAEVVLALLRAGQITLSDLEVLQTKGEPAARRSHLENYERALAECPRASLSTYKTNFRRLAERFGDAGVDAVTSAELSVLGSEIHAKSVANGGIGIGAESSFIHAARFFYRVAITDGVLHDNPAATLEMPRRRRRVRRALSESELRDIYRTVMETSQDPTLDILLLDFHRETAARRGGAVALRLCDINVARKSVLLREKGGHEREVPASRALLTRVVDLAHRRHATSSQDGAFRYRNGQALTRRRYNTIFKHVQQNVAWALRVGVSIHWFRHTTLSDIATVAGIRVAAAYAGHLDRSVTDIYTVPTFEDLLAAHHQVFPFD